MCSVSSVCSCVLHHAHFFRCCSESEARLLLKEVRVYNLTLCYNAVCGIESEVIFQFELNMVWIVNVGLQIIIYEAEVGFLILAS